MQNQTIVEYICHSGYWIADSSACFLFDYSQGSLPTPEKPLLIFVSHSHEDHFHPSIFAYGEQFPNTRYFLADEVPVTQTELTIPKERIFRMAPDETRSLDDGITVRTLRSTDLGVAFLVHHGEKTYYHAGDLHWWYWDGEPDNEEMTRRFQKEVEKLQGEKIDLAFLVLDPRQEHNYAMGLDYYARHTEMARIFPMHLWGDYALTQRIQTEECAKPYAHKLMTVSKEGETYEV